MTALLNDDREVVRVFVASALGFIGPNARQALPTLMRLRDEARINANLIVPGPSVDVAGIYDSVIGKISK
jgi:hypothetical protein